MPKATISNEKFSLKQDVLNFLGFVNSRIARRKVAHRNREVVADSLKKKEIKVELGAGPTKKPNWLSIDLSDSDINMDLTASPLPFPDNSVDYFYSSHVFEHFSYPKPMLSIMEECYRCLKAGGKFDICVPNAAIYLKAYFFGDYPEETKAEHWLPAFHKNSKIDIVNYTAYMDGHHKHMFDPEGLLKILTQAGFQNATLREYDQEVDSESRKWESICAFAIK